MNDIAHVIDFALGGVRPAPWDALHSFPLRPVDGPGLQRTSIRAAYSDTGLYLRFDCDDDRLACTDLKDGADLWTEDVVEAFLWTDDTKPVYFEYEISPLGAELPLLVSNDHGTFMGWSPWHYEGDRLIRRATTVRGGPKQPGAVVTGWSAEVFIPFALLRGLGNVPPTTGTRWRANFCRVDYSGSTRTLYSWSPGVTETFHEIDRFNTLTFE